MHDDDFERRLAQRLRAYEARIPDEGLEPWSTRPRRLGWAAALAAAAGAVVVGGVLGLVLLNRPGGLPVGASSPSPVVTASPSPEATLTPSATPDASATPVPTSTRMPSASAGGSPAAKEFVQAAVYPSAWTAGITAWPEGFVAVGGVGESAASPSPMVWTSPDGRDWESVVPVGLESVVLSDVVATLDGRLLAFGNLHDGSLSGRFRAWLSADAESWEPIEFGFPALFGFHGVASGPRGFVLEGTGTSSDGTDSTHQLWYSSNGLDWRLTHEMDQSVPKSPSAVGAGAEGFVVVGQQGWITETGTAQDPYAFALASSDGVTWIEAAAADAVLRSNSGLWAVAPLGGDWLAAPFPVDRPGGSRAIVLDSVNGLDWSESAALALQEYSPGRIPRLIGDGTFAILGIGIGVEGHMALWISTDGVDWRPLEIEATDAVDTATVGETTVLALLAPTDGPPRMEFWVAESPG